MALQPSEIPFRPNRATALSRLMRYDVRNWLTKPHKKPLLRQAREAADLWRRYRYVPYQYLKDQLYRSEIGAGYSAYIPTIVADRYVYEINSKEAIDILEDKMAYDARMAELGLPFVRTIAIVHRTEEALTIHDRDDREMSLAALWAFAKQHSPLGLFIKPRLGLAGLGAFRLHVGESGFERDGVTLTESDLLQRLRATEYTEFLVQPYFQQHEIMARLNPHSVNTIRVLALRTEDRVELIGAYLRVGAGARETDNWSYGGYALHVDMRTGQVGAVACVHDDYAAGRSLTHHGATNVAFGSVIIPFAPAVLDLITKGGLGFAPARLIGWDIAIGPDGPCAVEANAIPGFRTVQVTGGGLRDTCYGREMAQRFAWA